MKRAVISIFFILFFPLLAGATGFAKQSLFLSRDGVVDGETVSIYSVVFNTDSVAFSGLMEFSDNNKTIGTTSVTLSAGQASTVSIPWKTTVGPHAIVARLEDQKGTILEENLATFTVLSKTQIATEPQVTATFDPVDSSDPVAQKITQVAPWVGSRVVPLFTKIDSFRNSSAQNLGNGVIWAKRQVIVQSTGSTDPGVIRPVQQKDFVTEAKMILTTGLVYFFTILRYIVAHIGAFYPVVAGIFFYILWKIVARIRRPKH